MSSARGTTVIPALPQRFVERAARGRNASTRSKERPPIVSTALPVKERHDPTQATARTREFYILCAGLAGLAIIATALCLMDRVPHVPLLYLLHSVSLQASSLLASAILFLAALFVALRFHGYRQLVSRLANSEARYRLLAEGSSDVVLLIDEHGLCRTVSPSVQDLLGDPPEAMLDRVARGYVHPEDLAAVREAALVARSDACFGPSLIHRLRHRSGAWIWCETRMRGQPNGGLVCAIRDISDQHAREAVLIQRASVDSLTGLLNRDSLKQALAMAIGLANRDQQSLALILFDIDHFKRINDAHGHPIGDRVLQSIGEACGQAVRMTDHAGRVGGEEFALVLPSATIAAATDVCTRLRQSIDAAPMPDVDGAPIRVTISAGIAVLHSGVTESELVSAADRALYVAKDAGRDCAFASIGEQFIRAL
jgi:diguanylate cyclase (GGDEF)-like protein/PAS domain S-box-containing protein